MLPTTAAVAVDGTGGLIESHCDTSPSVRGPRGRGNAIACARPEPNRAFTRGRIRRAGSSRFRQDGIAAESGTAPLCLRKHPRAGYWTSRYRPGNSSHESVQLLRRTTPSIDGPASVEFELDSSGHLTIKLGSCRSSGEQTVVRGLIGGTGTK